MPNILIVDDDAALRDSLAETVRDLGHQPRLAASGREALAILASEKMHGVLLDLRMPGGMDGIEVLRRICAQADGPPVVVLTAFASAENTIEAMRIGAFDHLTKPIGRQELSDLLGRMATRPVPSPSAGRADDQGGTLIGSSEPMRRVQKTIGLAADSDATVLILGETGTGKELVARALHEHGRRKHEPFIAVNCAAIPAELLESELFGHRRARSPGRRPTEPARSARRTAARCSSTKSATCPLRCRRKSSGRSRNASSRPSAASPSRSTHG
jgi:DNA-binding NtrC family response regulator